MTREWSPTLREVAGCGGALGVGSGLLPSRSSQTGDVRIGRAGAVSVWIAITTVGTASRHGHTLHRRAAADVSAAGSAS